MPSALATLDSCFFNRLESEGYNLVCMANAGLCSSNPHNEPASTLRREINLAFRIIVEK